MSHDGQEGIMGAMSSARHAVELLLKPELAALAAINPEACAAKTKRMARDPAAFARGATGLVAAWLARHHPGDQPWVWAVGDAHLGNLAVLATGPRRADSTLPVTIDVDDVDDEHPAPWSWDLLRLGASYAHAWPRLGGRKVATLVAQAVEAYAETLDGLRRGDPGAGRIDLNGLPEPVKAQVVEASREAAAKRHLAAHTQTRSRRLRLRGAGVTAEDAAGVAAIRTVWDAQTGLPDHTWEDAGLRLTDHGVSSRGRRRWLILVSERVAAGRFHRLLEVKERPPSCLDRVLGVTPFPPRAGPLVTVPMGGDPYQRILPLATGHLLVRTRCHARLTLPIEACDDGDRRRAAHLHGQLLARFHATGLARLLPSPDLAPIVTQARAEADRLGRHSLRLADHLNRCWAAFAP